MMNLRDLQTIARGSALNVGIDPALACAVCEHESSWNPYACRYEPAFHERYISSMKGLTITEMQSRATSYGLMQVIGQTAREMGFIGTYLTELCDPLNGTTFGCRKLKRCLEAEGQNVPAALLRYNGGGDAAYPSLVLQFLMKFKAA